MAPTPAGSELAAAEAAGEQTPAAAPAGGDGAGPERGAGRPCRPRLGPRAWNKGARAPVGRTPARRPPPRPRLRLRPATPGQAPAGGARAARGRPASPSVPQSYLTRPRTQPGGHGRPRHARQPRAGPAVSRTHRLPSPLSRTGPAAAVPSSPPPERRPRSDREESSHSLDSPLQSSCPCHRTPPKLKTPAATVEPV
ncbi:uncharacterized protein LOC111184175 [Delphinapterus leucas]|uniref:Uncharacterized protein LOC111184175 n=1 Tax=Delphinapterus leucas TaxID=9749 RepID=A0A7F8KG20_DELLE|nr:uncharacterized protein LOC111184175 [Delphinapterus leucas]